MDYQEKIIKTIGQTLPAVISIAASKGMEDVQQDLVKMGLDPNQFTERIENEMDEEGKVSISGGSGFIVSGDGIILTNKHVVADKSASYKVIMGKEKYNVEIVGKDPLADIAILKLIDAPKNLPSIPLGNSQNLKLGTCVVAIGNALGEFQNTVSTGIVSGLSRFLSAVTDIEGHQEKLRGLIQTDAAINPGNSGGPLINMEGEVIGINSAVVFGAQNIGFAIPINKAKKDLEEIKKFGHIRTPFLGIRYLLLNKEIARHFQIPIDHGALIIREHLPGDYAVLPGSAAETAGIKEHDIIIAANGKNITEKDTLEDMLDNSAIGEKLELEILRKGRKLTVSLELEDRAKFI